MPSPNKTEDCQCQWEGGSQKMIDRHKEFWKGLRTWKLFGDHAFQVPADGASLLRSGPLSKLTKVILYAYTNFFSLYFGHHHSPHHIRCHCHCVNCIVLSLYFVSVCLIQHLYFMYCCCYIPMNVCMYDFSTFF